MKKRKELNALIGLGDSKRKKTKKGSGHRLLRTEPPDSESESSSEDDFNNPNSGANFGKRSYAQCCNVCYPLFLFIVLAACVMACAGLIWMQIALKEDLDSLKEKLHSMESNQKVSSNEIPKINEDLKNKERKLDDIENGDMGLSKLWFNLTAMNKKITMLDSAVNHLKANLKSAADLVSLPATVEDLQKSVATIGSTLTSVQHDVKTMQDALEKQKKDDDLKKTMDVTDFNRALGEVNKTEEQLHLWTDEQIHILLSTVADLHQRVASLENGSKHSVQSNDAAASVGNFSERVETEKVKELPTTKATPEDEKKMSAPLTEMSAPLTEMSAPLTEMRTSRRPRFLTSKRIKRNPEINCPSRLFLPGISSLKDLDAIFHQAGVGRNSFGVTYQDLKKVLGSSAPHEDAFKCFDADGDQRYSLMELRAAVGL